jgi:nucleoid-associated protein YgaU
MSVAIDYSYAPACPSDPALLPPAAPRRPALRAVPVREPARPAAPERERRSAAGTVDTADVAVLHAPRGGEVAAPLRLTRRGVVVLSLLVAALGGALVWVMMLSAPSGTAATPMPASVVVHSGDTVWSIASRYSGDRDPGVIADAIAKRNHLQSAQLVPGQVLRLR